MKDNFRSLLNRLISQVLVGIALIVSSLTEIDIPPNSGWFNYKVSLSVNDCFYAFNAISAFSNFVYSFSKNIRIVPTIVSRVPPFFTISLLHFLFS